MYPLQLFAILEKADPAFRDFLYPKDLRCKLDGRIIRAIEEQWPAYFPTRKECRGPAWSLSIPENEPLYEPNPKSRRKLKEWKIRIKGTIAEMRSFNADISWQRFIVICRSISSLRPLIKYFKPLIEVLIQEESMWPRHKGIMVGPEEYFESQMQALLAPGSPYLKSDPYRLRQLRAHMPTIEKICLIGSMRSLFDRPLMILALLQTCVETSKFCRFWLPIPGHIEGIVKTPSSLTFRKTWLEHAMQVSGAVKKSGKSCQRTWAKLLVASNEPDLINEKAIEVNRWLKGTKLPSLKNVKRAGEIIFNRTDASRRSKEIAADLWLFSWMIALWLEKHFTEISKEFKGDRQKIQSYYRGFYGYL